MMQFQFCRVKGLHNLTSNVIQDHIVVSSSVGRHPFLDDNFYLGFVQGLL